MAKSAAGLRAKLAYDKKTYGIAQVPGAPVEGAPAHDLSLPLHAYARDATARTVRVLVAKIDGKAVHFRAQNYRHNSTTVLDVAVVVTGLAQFESIVQASVEKRP